VAKFDGPNADAIADRLLLAGSENAELLTRFPEMLQHFVKVAQAELAAE
jgi:hypothetical protein